ncbi:MAG: SDR family NAD(P)-dependent oxidoreductase, partial [Acidimicrobiales bacterium]
MIDATGRPQSVLVLGGSSEIAQAILAKLCPGRCRTVILAGRDGPKLAAAAEHAAVVGADTIEIVDFDATDIEQHGKVIDGIFKQFGDIDLVVVAAGVLGHQEED